MARQASSFLSASLNLDISNDTVLEVTDFAEEKEIKDQIMLWDSQIDELKHQLGAG